MRVGVARREEGLKREAADAERVNLNDSEVSAGEAVYLRIGDLAAGKATQPARGGDMVISVDVRLECKLKSQAQLLEAGKIAIHRLKNRVEQHGLSCVAAADQVSKGRGF